MVFLYVPNVLIKKLKKTKYAHSNLKASVIGFLSCKNNLCLIKIPEDWDLGCS